MEKEIEELMEIFGLTEQEAEDLEKEMAYEEEYKK